MIPELFGIFGAGTAGVFVLATESGRRWIWAVAFLESLLAFYELSFVIEPAREWIRLDLVVTLPLFSMANLVLAIYASRKAGAGCGLTLAASAIAAPIWFFFLR